MTRLCHLADVSREAEIGLPAGKVDLKKWLHDFSTEDYRNVAKGHWAMGGTFNRNRKSMTINVESIGGHLVIGVMARLALTPRFLKSHCIEETASFAADIYRKLNRRVSNPKERCRVLS